MRWLSLNVGPADRFARGTIGLLLAGIAIYFRQQPLWQVLGLGVGAGVLLLTALLSSCPLYLPFGISTRRRSRPPQPTAAERP